MKIAIAGSGAMGASFGFLLAEAHQEVILIDSWCKQVETIREKGLTFKMGERTSKKKMNICYPHTLKQQVDHLDLVILFTKAMQLEDMLNSIKTALTPHTSVLCLLNGIGHEKIISQYVPKENFLLGHTLWSASLLKPGEVKLYPGGSVNLKNRASTRKEAALEIVDILNKAGLAANYAQDIMTSIYKKLGVNACCNGLCTLFDTTIAEFGETAPAAGIVSQILSEIIAVAKVEGTQLNHQEMITTFKDVCDREKMGNHYPSMHQDLMKNHRRTEVDYINGAIAKKGKDYGISTPYNQLITDLIHIKEALLNAK